MAHWCLILVTSLLFLAQALSVLSLKLTPPPVTPPPTCGTWGPTQWLNSFTTNQAVIAPLSMYGTDQQNYLSSLGPALVPVMELIYGNFPGFWGCQPSVIRDGLGNEMTYKYDQWGYIVSANSTTRGFPYELGNENPFILTNYTVSYQVCSPQQQQQQPSTVPNYYVSSLVTPGDGREISAIIFVNELDPDNGCLLEAIDAIFFGHNSNVTARFVNYTYDEGDQLPYQMSGLAFDEERPRLELDLISNQTTGLLQSGNITKYTKGYPNFGWSLAFEAYYNDKNLLVSYQARCLGYFCGGNEFVNVTYAYDSLDRWQEINVNTPHSSGWSQNLVVPMNWQVTYDSDTGELEQVTFSYPHNEPIQFSFSY